MTTGKIEYSPDYKSKSQVRRIAAQTGKCWCGENHSEAGDAARAITAERDRLEREVIEAAKHRRRERDAMLHLGTIAACDRFSASDNRFESTLTILLEFEAKQK